MKKTATLFFSLASAVALQAQNERLVDPILEAPQTEAKKAVHTPQAESSVTFWSEDFANGIPTGWSQNGSPGTALWEWRGTGTPSNAVGSRGAFAGGMVSGNQGAPLNSSTTANGFVIFDSDYLDNNGNRNTSGLGPAPAPHTGRLTTSVIDLSAQPNVELKFEMFARRFQARFLVAFSIDGGLTFTDTVEFFGTNVLSVNSATTNGVEASTNVSGIIGGQSNAVMQFIFDGTPGNANGNGYYYWMIDDIELRTPPSNSILLTALSNAPAFDMLYGPAASGYAKYGYMHSNQIVPVAFDANMYNYGSQTQTNVALEVEIWNAATLSIVTTLTSPGCATLLPLDTCDFNTLTTMQWTPPATEAEYIIVYKAVSDSILSANTTSTDTVSFFVSDSRYSLDRNVFSSTVGTNSANPEITAMGVTYNLDNEDPDSTGSGLVFLEGINIAFTDDTDSTADIEIAIFDTLGFEFNAGFTTNPIPLFSRIYNLNGTANVGNVRVTFPFGEEDSLYNPATQTWADSINPLALPVGDYFVIVTYFPNAVDGVVRVLNDETFDQPGEASVMQLADGNWFSGFTSRAYEAPHFRLLIAEAPAYDISVKENELNNFSVYPNPTSGLGNIQFEMGGTYSIRVIDMVGNVITSNTESVNANEKVALDLSNVPAGVYLVTVEGDGVNKTVKLTVQ
jgi:hypothetical protein